MRLAIDDFGTGYSSLSYLHRFPVDVLKVDRSFVSGVATGSDEEELTRTIVRLGQSLGLVVVAEGIEESRAAQLAAGHGLRPGPGLPVQQAGAARPSWRPGSTPPCPAAAPVVAPPARHPGAARGLTGVQPSRPWQDDPA